MIITTTETVPGYTITEVKGVVTGNIVQSKHLIKDIGAGLKSLIGGEIGSYTAMLTDAREQAQVRLIKDADRMAADAIVNLRYTTSAIAANMSEILAYGTAVKIKKD